MDSMDKIYNCKRCKRLFQSEIYKEVCPECKRELDKKFGEVRDYIRKHKDAGLYIVSEVCEVPVRQLQEWIREERLLFDKDSKVSLPCMNCGAPIRTGKYCDECKKNMHREMSKAYNEAVTNKEKQSLKKVKFRKTYYKTKGNDE